jgi:hypothetical protein
MDKIEHPVQSLTEFINRISAKIEEFQERKKN